MARRAPWRSWLAYAYASAGRLADAVAKFDTLFRRVEGSIVWDAIAAGVAAAAGDARRLNTTLAGFRKREERGERMPHYAFFTLHLSAGDTDAALDRLEAAAAEREAVLVYLRVVPRYRAILGHPRVRRVLRTIWPDDFPEA